MGFLYAYKSNSRQQIDNFGLQSRSANCAELAEKFHTSLCSYDLS